MVPLLRSSFARSVAVPLALFATAPAAQGQLPGSRTQDGLERFRGSEVCDWDLRTPELTACLTDHLEAERAQLDRVLMGLEELMDRGELRGFQREQDAWERRIERSCDDAAFRYGTLGLEGVALLSCMVEETIRRRFQTALRFGARTRVDFDERSPCFVPDSDRVALVGWVGERRYAANSGVPGGGEDLVLVLNLDLPMCLDYGEGPLQVTALQLVGRSRSLSRGLARYIGGRVEVEGRLFLARSAEDQTPVLIMVDGVAAAG